MFNGLFGLGRAYKRLPPHQDFAELAANIEHLADYLVDRSVGSFAGTGYREAPDRWERRLGNDLKLLIEYARASVPSNADGLHYFSGLGGKP